MYMCTGRANETSKPRCSIHTMIYRCLIMDLYMADDDGRMHAPLLMHLHTYMM